MFQRFTTSRRDQRINDIFSLVLLILMGSVVLFIFMKIALNIRDIVLLITLLVKTIIKSIIVIELSLLILEDGILFMVLKRNIVLVIMVRKRIFITMCWHENNTNMFHISTQGIRKLQNGWIIFWTVFRTKNSWSVPSRLHPLKRCLNIFVYTMTFMIIIGRSNSRRSFHKKVSEHIKERIGHLIHSFKRLTKKVLVILWLYMVIHKLLL